jgi:hypothetical protein
MTQTPDPNEPSWADAVTTIAGSSELSEQTRRHWATSIRRIAKALDKPLETIPARYSAVWPLLAQLHPVPAGLTAKTLRNHKSNVKSALLWLARANDISQARHAFGAAMARAARKTGPGHPPVNVFFVDAILLWARCRTSRRG